MHGSVFPSVYAIMLATYAIVLTWQLEDLKPTPAIGCWKTSACVTVQMVKEPGQSWLNFTFDRAAIMQSLAMRLSA